MFAVGMIIAVIGALILLFIWALCRMAAISDERMRKIMKDLKDKGA